MTDIDFAAVSNGKAMSAKPEIIHPEEGSLVIKTLEAKAVIDAYLPKAELIRIQAFAIKIKDAQSRELASETGVRVKNTIKDVNLAVENQVKEAKKFVSESTSIGKKIVAVLDQAKRYLADELLKDKQRQDLERAKREEAIRKADEAREKALQEEAKRLNIKPPEAIEETRLPKKTKEETQTRTDVGVSFAKGKWTYEVLNITQVPKEYLLPKENGPLINQKIKQGLRDELTKDKKVKKAAIPGIRIFYKEDIAFR